MYQADGGNFWLVQFASAKDDFDTYEPGFVEAERQLGTNQAQTGRRRVCCRPVRFPGRMPIWKELLRDGSGDGRTADL